MKRHWLTILVVGLVLGTGAAWGGAGGDEKSIQGTWKVVSVEVRGKSLGDAAKGLSAVITKDKIEFKDNGKSDGDFEYKLDATKKPKWIDLAPLGKDGKPGKTAKGIYQLDGDNLKICHPDPGKDRPTALQASPETILFVLRREK